MLVFNQNPETNELIFIVENSDADADDDEVDIENLNLTEYNLEEPEKYSDIEEDGELYEYNESEKAMKKMMENIDCQNSSNGEDNEEENFGDENLNESAPVASEKSDEDNVEYYKVLPSNQY